MKKFTLYGLIFLVLSSGFIRLKYNETLLSTDLYSTDESNEDFESNTQDLNRGKRLYSRADNGLDINKIVLSGIKTSAKLYDYNIPILPTKFVLNTPPPEPNGQGYYQGSCTAWAVAYVAMSYYFNFDQGYSNLYSKVFSPAFLYNQTKTTDDCNSGSYFETYCDTVGAFNFLMKEGVCKWSDMPYYYDGCYCYNIADAKDKENAKKYRIMDYYMVNSESVKTLKQLLYRGDPIVVTIDTDEDFYYLGNVVWKPDCSKEAVGYHAMLIVGYDDIKKAFKILNSYGIYWGDAGYLWLSYDHIQCISEAFVLVPDYSRIDIEEEKNATVVYYNDNMEQVNEDNYDDEFEFDESENESEYDELFN